METKMKELRENDEEKTKYIEERRWMRERE
jgi:hypothetical protein